MSEKPDTPAAVESRITQLESVIVDLRLKSVETSLTDHETRLRLVEKIGTQFTTLYALVIGGGALSAVNLILLLQK